MDQRAIEQSVSRYKDAVLSVFSPESIILFGSYAKGQANAESDIDIAVVFDRYDDNHLRAMQQLCKLTRKTDLRIEPILLEEQNDDSGFLEHVKKTGVTVYQRNAMPN